VKKSEKRNFISEWFGHRIYPKVISTPKSLAEQKAHLCPFLSGAKGESTQCVKNTKSRGVCTISAMSNGPRQDWVACPYRVLDSKLLDAVATRLYASPVELYAAPRLGDAACRKEVGRLLADGDRVVVYFDHKVGGEISLSATNRSPEMAFDVTMVELAPQAKGLRLGKFGILEIQTMDFHGSYGKSVSKLQNALELHPANFPKVLQEHQWWAAEGIEGPNIANVFKRTFYQMMFKFQFGAQQGCAGTALAISASVWDSWQPFLAAPVLSNHTDGTARLLAPGEMAGAQKPPAWIYVFDFHSAAKSTPSPIRLVTTIGLSAAALGHYALDLAPKEASKQLTSESGIYASLRRRIGEYWPDAEIQ